MGLVHRAYSGGSGRSFRRDLGSDSGRSGRSRRAATLVPDRRAGRVILAVQQAFLLSDRGTAQQVTCALWMVRSQMASAIVGSSSFSCNSSSVPGSHHGGCLAVAVLQNFDQVAAFLVLERSDQEASRTITSSFASRASMVVPSARAMPSSRSRRGSRVHRARMPLRQAVCARAAPTKVFPTTDDDHVLLVANPSGRRQVTDHGLVETAS